MSLLSWGWNSAWAEQFESHLRAGLAPARVTQMHRGGFELETEIGPVNGELSGRLEFASSSAIDLPVTGDFVAVTPTDPALIFAVLNRRSLFTRAVDGAAQPLAANIDVAFLVTSLDHDWSPRRLERYIVLSRDAGARPVIILNKRDLSPDPHAALAHARRLAPSVLLSAHSDDVAQALAPFVAPLETAALLGSSGVGKSTIVNSLLGAEIQATSTVRESDSKGRHTTTARTLHRLPAGWLLLDMPGIRSVGISADEAAVNHAFAQIAALAAHCRFADCSHSNEPGCAVLPNINTQQLAHYRQLLREAAYQHRREDATAARAEKEKWKKIHKQMKSRPNKRD